MSWFHLARATEPLVFHWLTFILVSYLDFGVVALSDTFIWADAKSDDTNLATARDFLSHRRGCIHDANI